MICEKCGFEYSSDSCPVCAVQATNEAVELPEKKTSGLGITGMVFGIINIAILVLNLPVTLGSVIFAGPLYIIPAFIVGLIPAIVGMVLSTIAKKKLSTDKLAKIGKILSLIGIIARVAIIVIVIALTIVMFLLGMVFGIGSSIITTILPSATY